MSLQLLGGLSRRQFLARHWQKRPLLVRRAIPGFSGVVPVPELLRLACREEVESRLVTRDGRRWQLRHGPFSARELARMPARRWTVLVQGVNLHVPEAAALLERFAFLPRARLDDVMVSYAAPGGGVGPHVDSYDVFLLQGEGRRRWRIASSPDTTPVRGAPLAVLARFDAEEEWVLEPGDMLYLPPGYAHDGVALDRCTTYSIGFRAPTTREVGAALLTYLEETLGERLPEHRYSDAGTAATARPGRIPPRMVRFACDVAARLRGSAADVEDALGRYLSEPKPHVVFSRPSRPLSAKAFWERWRSAAAVLDRRTILLYGRNRFYINGESLAAAPRDRRALEQLADTRTLAAPRAPSENLRRLLHRWYVDGWLHLGESP